MFRCDLRAEQRIAASKKFPAPLLPELHAGECYDKKQQGSR